MLIKRKSIEAEANAKRASKTRQKIKFAPVTISEMQGCRYLHFGTEWVQGAMRLRKPDWLELEYAQQMMAWMLFIEHPQHIVQLGLGSASLTKFCYRQFPTAQITAVELNPAVIHICRSMFKLPELDDRLHVLEMDAEQFVNQVEHHNTLDVLQVDLYDATARGPVLDSVEFYQACSDCLKPSGIMTVNLFGDHPSYRKNLKALQFVFEEVICLPEVHDGNVVAIAFNNKTQLDFSALQERALAIKLATKLPAKSWVSGIQYSINGISS
jgi:spermidine synthase